MTKTKKEMAFHKIRNRNAVERGDATHRLHPFGEQKDG
jgi:hypothetical protein